LLYAALRATAEEFAAKMQREMVQCAQLKKILASHKKTRYYASHRMLKRSRRGSKARPKQNEPRQRSE
jgi:hypothetical protein